jgi:hypothetical protein
MMSSASMTRGLLSVGVLTRYWSYNAREWRKVMDAVASELVMLVLSRTSVCARYVDENTRVGCQI